MPVILVAKEVVIFEIKSGLSSSWIFLSHFVLLPWYKEDESELQAKFMVFAVGFVGI